MRPAAAVPSRSCPFVPSRSAVGRLSVVLLAALTLLVPAVTSAGAAAAAPDPNPHVETATAAPRPGLPHCVLAAGDTATARCYPTFRAAIAAATGGRVTDAPLSPAAAAIDPRFSTAIEGPVTNGVTLLGYEFADANWGGASLSMTGAGRCDDSSDVDYRFPTLSSTWNDRISSFKSYSNCAQQLFRGTYFSGGTLTGIVANLTYVGATANDQASSVTFN